MGACRCVDCLWEEVRFGPPEPHRTERAVPRMTLAEAKEIAGTLGSPGKMPGYSYGLDAWECKRGQKLMTVQGAVCSSCYAMSGWYTLKSPVKGQMRRQASLRNDGWVDAMVRQIEHYCKPPNHWFRWHDSGDLQGVWHLRNIVTVCRRTPAQQHWLPTREVDMVAEWAASCSDVPENLILRISADLYDEKPVVPPALARFYTSTVHRYSGLPVLVDPDDRSLTVECKAHTRDNRCGPCRACWSKEVQNVSYLQH